MIGMFIKSIVQSRQPAEYVIPVLDIRYGAQRFFLGNLDRQRDNVTAVIYLGRLAVLLLTVS